MARPVIAVVGPTAAGKSDLALGLARALGGEVVNADSMQLYRGMDIGTAKLHRRRARRRAASPARHLGRHGDGQRRRVPAAGPRRHRRHPGAGAGRRSWSAGPACTSRAALDKLSSPAPTRRVRERLEDELAGLGPGPPCTPGSRRLDPAAAAAILPSNGRRIVRALEVIELSGRSVQRDAARLPSRAIPPVQVGLRLDRAELDQRIAARVSADVAGRVRGGGARRWSGAACASGPDGQPGPRLRAGAPLPGRGVDARTQAQQETVARDQAVRPPAGIVVPAGPPDPLAPAGRGADAAGTGGHLRVRRDG